MDTNAASIAMTIPKIMVSLGKKKINRQFLEEVLIQQGETIPDILAAVPLATEMEIVTITGDDINLIEKVK